jgi:hypothetical protein
MYDIRIFCPRTAVKIPSWIRDWSVDTGTLQEAILKKRFDGTKTLNLYQLVDDLVASTFLISEPEIGRIYVYLDVR